MAFKLTMKVGGRQSKFNEDAALMKASAEFTNILSQQVRDVASGITVATAKRIAKRLSRLGRKENGKIFRIVADLTSLRSPSYASNFLEKYTDAVVAQASFTNLDRYGNVKFTPRGQMKWIPHMKSTIDRKKRDIKAGNLGVRPNSVDRYFYRTGQLRDYFKNNADTLGNGLGDVQVYLRDEKDRFVRSKNPKGTVASLSISFARSVKRGLLPGLVSGNWTETDPTMKFERGLISDESVLTKLQGSPGRHRALVQPVVNYFLLYRYPRLISSVIDVEFRKSRSTLSGGRGIDDFTGSSIPV